MEAYFPPFPMMAYIKPKQSILLVCSVVIGISLLLAVGLPATTLGQESTQQARIIFRNPLSVEEAMSEARAFHLSPIILEHEYALGQEEAIGFFGVENSADSLRTHQVLELHHAFLRDMAASTQRQIAQSTFLARQVRNSLQVKASDIDAAIMSTQSIRITRMTVEGTFRDIQAASKQQNGNIQEFQLQQSRYTFLQTRLSSAISRPTPRMDRHSLLAPIFRVMQLALHSPSERCRSSTGITFLHENFLQL